MSAGLGGMDLVRQVARRARELCEMTSPELRVVATFGSPKEKGSAGWREAQREWEGGYKKGDLIEYILEEEFRSKV